MQSILRLHTLSVLVLLFAAGCGDSSPGSDGGSDSRVDGRTTDSQPSDGRSGDGTVGDGLTGECAGQVDGTPCGNSSASDCDGADTCQAGVCVPNFVAAGTACGDTTDNDCTSPDTCDGTGTCQNNHEVDGSSCGDTADTECDNPDTCQAGVCEPNYEGSGATCGDTSDSACTNPDTCDGSGSCQANHEADGTSCGDSADTECDNPDTCQAGACAANYELVGVACGDSADDACTDPDTCDGAGACLANHQADGTSCGNSADTECDNPDTCQAGACASNYEAMGVGCGDPTDNDCTKPDSCNGAGTCLDNDAITGTACGDSSNTDCTNPDTCDGFGGCLANHAVSGTACGDPGNTSCTNPDSCNGSGTCLANHAAAGTTCGDPSTTECSNPDSCDGAGVCSANHQPAGTSCGDPTDNDCDNPDSCDGSGSCGENFELVDLFCADCNRGAGLCDLCDGVGVCNDSSLCTAAGTLLSTPFNSNNGHRGNMFDVVPTSNLRVTGFDVNIDFDTTIEVYMKTGTHVGFQNNPGAWTFIGSAFTTSAGFDQPSRVPFAFNIPLSAGATVAFYVTSADTAVSLNYTNGTVVGNVAAGDANLSILEGYGLEYPFTAGSGTFFEPRVWNGRIEYQLAQGTDTTASGNATAAGVMFDVTALTNTLISSFSGDLPAGTHNLQLWYRDGTHVGSEGNSAAWTALSTATVVSPGGVVALPFAFNGVTVPAGETVAFYITTDGTSSFSALTMAPAQLGQVIADDGVLQVRAGTSVAFPFGATATTYRFLGSVFRSICP